MARRLCPIHGTPLGDFCEGCRRAIMRLRAQDVIDAKVPAAEMSSLDSLLLRFAGAYDIVATETPPAFGGPSLAEQWLRKTESAIRHEEEAIAIGLRVARRA